MTLGTYKQEGPITQPETILFEKDNLKITDRQVFFDNQTFLLEEITMVTVQRTGPKPTGGIALVMLILMAVLLLLTNSSWFGDYARVGVGILFFGLIVLALMMTKETFAVWVITEEKVGEVFTSSKESAAQEIANVLNKVRTR
jgi:hypothetical protein